SGDIRSVSGTSSLQSSSALIARSSCLTLGQDPVTAGARRTSCLRLTRSAELRSRHRRARPTTIRLPKSRTLAARYTHHLSFIGGPCERKTACRLDRRCSTRIGSSACRLRRWWRGEHIRRRREPIGSWCERNDRTLVAGDEDRALRV